MSDDTEDPRISIIEDALDAKLLAATPDWWPDTRDWAEQIVKALDAALPAIGDDVERNKP